MPSNHVLILSHRRGFEADRVLDGLKQRSIFSFRFNFDLISSPSTISIELVNGELIPSFTCDNRKITAKQIKFGWFQQSPPFLLSPSTETQILQRNSFLTAWDSAFEFINCPWINKPANAMRAANKVIQLNAALESGLSVPTSLVSNDPHQIREFCKRNPLLVAKNLSTPWIEANDGLHVAYTKRVNAEWIDKDSGLLFAPIMYQVYHKRRRDIRVVIIGDDLYSVHTTFSCPKSKYDIRRLPSNQGQYFPYDLPSDIKNKLMKLLEALGINYCSADLFESEDGSFYFIDLNVTGSWWWVDDIYNGNISRAFVDYIEKHIKSDRV